MFCCLTTKNASAEVGPKEKAMGNKRVWYREEDGKVRFKYGESEYDLNNIEGDVPPKICRLGEKTIAKYVKKEIVKIETVCKKFEEFGKNLNVPVSVKHKGVLLEGKIIGTDGEFLTVRLESPKKYHGERSINFGGASAMAGHDIFEDGDKPKLSRYAIEAAQKILRWIYDDKKHEEKHKDTIEFVKKLNNREEND